MTSTQTLSPVVPDALQQDLHVLLTKCDERELMLATAESCTGGMLVPLLTDVPGVTHVFDRGFGTYTDRAKQEMLSVAGDLLQAHGAVSREAALAMAQGVIDRSQAHLARAVTGFADTGEEPGPVHFACTRAGRRTAHRQERFSMIGRGATRLECSRVGVEMMTEML